MPSPQLIDSPSHRFPAGFLLTARMIWASLLLGQVIAGGVLLTQVHPSRPLEPKATRILLIVAGAMVGVGIVFVFVAPKLFFKPTGDNQVLGRQCLSAMILPMAMLEGASMVGLVAMALSNHLLPAAVVPGISLLVQLTRFPRSAI